MGFMCKGGIPANDTSPGTKGNCLSIPTSPDAIILYVLVGALIVSLIAIYVVYRVLKNKGSDDVESGGEEDVTPSPAPGNEGTSGETPFLRSPIERDPVSIMPTSLLAPDPEPLMTSPTVAEEEESSLDVNNSDKL